MEQNKQEGVKLKPYQKRIFNMSQEVLMGHWALIELKQSSLPSNSRELIQKRISYLVGKGKIKMEELNNLKKQLKDEFIKKGTRL